MATAKIGKDGDKVVLKLSFHEAEALTALLARVGVSTHERIHEETYDMACRLIDLMAEVEAENPGLLTGLYESFMLSGTALVDPGEAEEIEAGPADENEQYELFED